MEIGYNKKTSEFLLILVSSRMESMFGGFKLNKTKMPKNFLTSQFHLAAMPPKLNYSKYYPVPGTTLVL